MLIDTHCHLNFAAFEKDWKEKVHEANQAGVEQMIVVGTDIRTSEKAVEMSREVKALHASVGYHPHHARSLLNLHYARVQIAQITDQLKKLAKNKKVVAIGECGLDYHVYQQTNYDNHEITPQLKNLQKQLFGLQIQLAKELKLPLIIHSRDAGDDTLDTLNHFCKNDGQYPQAVVHCISGSMKFLVKVLSMGFYVGLDGNVTYSSKVQALAKAIPLEKLVVETDAPYLAPVPHRGLRNTPAAVKIVAEFVAKLKHVGLDKVEATTTKNAKQLFNL